jgi:hypothetical protein
MADLEDPLEQLASRAWRTKGARLRAYARLTAMQQWSNAAISFLSVYIIIGGIVAIVPALGLSTREQVWLSIGSISASILILAVNLLENGRNYQLRADRLHHCAIELLNLEIRISNARGQVVQGSTKPDSSVLGNDYVRIIEACQENHSSGDDAAFRASRRSDFNISPWFAPVIIVTEWIKSRGLFLLMILTPPALLLLLLLRVS